MPLKSDLTLNTAPFAAEHITEPAQKFHDKLAWLTQQPPFWFDESITPAEYRKLRAEGKTAYPAPKKLTTGQDTSIPSREAGRTISCRVFTPQSGNKSIGTYLHIHQGGWTLGSEQDFDPYLTRLVTDSDVTVVSVGYRKAPENPYPAGVEDCLDVADWLVDHAEEKFGAPLRIVGGESAGGHLTMLTILHLLRGRTIPYKGLKAAVVHYGSYDLSESPSVMNWKSAIALSKAGIEKFLEAFLPGHRTDAKVTKRPDVSPLYADWNALRGQLPPALFTVGTVDPLVDDTLFMGVKWLAAGGEAVIKVIPAATHAYITFDPSVAPGAEQSLKDVAEFLKDHLG